VTANSNESTLYLNESTCVLSLSQANKNQCVFLHSPIDGNAILFKFCSLYNTDTLKRHEVWFLLKKYTPPIITISMGVYILRKQGISSVYALVYHCPDVYEVDGESRQDIKITYRFENLSSKEKRVS